jgi:DNA (cytosine-5)-methyltransferase 1
MAALGLREVGIELDPWACATRTAAGHLTVRADVAQLPLHRMAGKTRGLIFSPPCGTFSAAGKGEGVGDLPLLHQALDDLAAGRDTRAQLASACSDPRTPLVVEPLRYALDLHPEWVALEQVPSVLPLWRHIARILRTRGYSTWTGILNAADYGLGQVRRRAVLIASRVREAAPPAPTHSEIGAHDLFGGYTPPWRTMAETLGWGYIRRPAPTVTGGGTATGGAEPFGNASRRAMLAAMGDPQHWAWARPAPTLSGTVGHVGGKHARGHLNLDPGDAAKLQGFPDGYPFQGNKGRVALQIGNAVPPLLALHVLSAATGINLSDAEQVAA